METAVGLLFKAVKEKRLTQEKIIELLYTNPRKIFHVPEQKNTYIELDPDRPFVVRNENLETKCKWSPFDGWELCGKIEKVILRNKSIL